MKLQKKIFRAIVGILLGLSLIMSATTTHNTVKAFEGMERRFFEQNMFLLQKYIDDEVNRLTDYVADWGAWDAMYSFMETRDTLRFEELLTGTSLRALDIDFLAVLDRDMNTVVGYMVNELGGEVPLEYERNCIINRFRFSRSQVAVFHAGIRGARFRLRGTVVFSPFYEAG